MLLVESRVFDEQFLRLPQAMRVPHRAIPLLRIFTLVGIGFAVSNRRRPNELDTQTLA